jgi:hypothetical protein
MPAFRRWQNAPDSRRCTCELLVNTTFGRVTVTRPPRQMQMSLRVQF